MSVNGLSSMQASAVDLHKRSKIHALAVQAYYNPACAPQELLRMVTADDAKLLEGWNVSFFKQGLWACQFLPDAAELVLLRWCAAAARPLPSMDMASQPRLLSHDGEPVLDRKLPA